MQSSKELLKRIGKCAVQVLPGAKKTAFWVVRITAIVSAVIFVLRYSGLLSIISDAVGPVMELVGLPGEAALAYVSGYFVNVYSCIAAAVTLNLSPRSMTILAVMVLCSHNMFVETAVQKKTGSSALRIVIVRTLSGIILALVLNRILPAGGVENIVEQSVEKQSFMEMFKPWAISLVKLCAKMIVLIFLLSVLQQILNEFGIMKVLTKFLKWPLKIFGLPEDTSFLWIVANTLGLAYGAAVMFQEKEKGVMSEREIKLLNSHIGISHSNLEDLILFASVGGIWWVMLLTRWVGSLVLVWEERAEFYIKDRFFS
ncbi:MAG: nucleoside recognition domain-containing protein [Candidatus Egerieousia sp.]